MAEELTPQPIESWPYSNSLRLQKVAQMTGLESIVAIGDPFLGVSDMSKDGRIERCAPVQFTGTLEQQRHLRLEFLDDVAKEFGFEITKASYKE